MGWFCAVRKSERGSYNQERAVKTYWIETVSNIIWERLWNDYLPPCWMSDKDQPGYKAFLGNRAKTFATPVANCFTGMPYCRMNSSKKRKDNSFNAALNKAKQIKSSSKIRSKLLNNFFLEEDFKVKFAKAFRYVESVKHLLFWDIILSIFL